MSLFDANWEIQVLKLLPPVVRNADFILKSMDFRAGDPENQIIHYLIESEKGAWKEFPPVGVGIWKYLQSTKGVDEIKRAIKVEMKNDVFPNPSVDVRKFPVILVNSTVIELQ